MRMMVISETLWIARVILVKKKKKKKIIVKLDFLLNFTKCTPSNVAMLRVRSAVKAIVFTVTTSKTIRSSLGEGFGQNPVPNFAQIIIKLFINFIFIC